MRVRHSKGEYQIAFEPLETALGRFNRVLVVSDETVAGLWLKGSPHPVFAVAPGENSKSLDAFRRVLDFLCDAGAGRDSTLIAVGGGVVGDLAGFAAATYMRGIDLVQVPTSLLAMVDSSVGGKVAINLPQAKNLVGAFHPPVHVSLCLETLATLPSGDFVSGTAEIWKMAAISDEPLFEELSRLPLVPGDTRLPQVVARSVDLKRMVVEADEFETSGERATLNYGHTVGHALESSLGYGSLLHGEAVAIGMVVEAAIGERMGVTPRGLSIRLSEGLRTQGLPVVLPTSDTLGLIGAMRLDKKASDEGLAFALLTGCGSCKLVRGVPEAVVLDCLQDYT